MSLEYMLEQEKGLLERDVPFEVRRAELSKLNTKNLAIRPSSNQLFIDFKLKPYALEEFWWMGREYTEYKPIIRWEEKNWERLEEIMKKYDLEPSKMVVGNRFHFGERGSDIGVSDIITLDRRGLGFVSILRGYEKLPELLRDIAGVYGIKDGI